MLCPAPFPPVSKPKKSTTKPKIGRWKDLLPSASKENIGEHWGSFPKQYLPEQQNWGHFKLRAHACFMKGRVQALVDTQVMRIRKDQHHYPLGSSWISGWVLQANLYPWNKTGSLYNWSTFLCYCYFFWLIKVLYSCVFSFPKIISYRDFFKDKHGLGQKWLLICQ